MGCVFHVRGKDFDVDAYLAQSELTPFRVQHAGEPRIASRRERGRYEMSGFSVNVSDASWDSLRTQAAEAIAFLRSYEQVIGRLRSTPGVDDMRLDFGIDLRVDREKVFAQYEYFPPELVSRAGALGLGLELSIYPKDLEELARARRG